ncbi:hypothetical protein PaecuDRAFT_1866 [Paenibacillus curdlanolyticus YK9]|uniref:Phosphodiester glycosidase domain-containing protein n=1 Tax=Paenibacillus curdlanolyticus YK9 TaxID=717606 RepID=E0I8B5_9BACL|nr:phosphodiester glycosidase family protein [Paenibacillus curdlanolyticus]EFM11420.1 hypothetical protein PaecuDRAFT_1866 [Paenibacillus curdlanolyticus YK9]
MGNAKLTSNTTVSGKTVYYIEADPSTVGVHDLGGANLTTSTKFGINGTFFDDASGNVVGIATTSAGSPVRYNSVEHAAGYTRGTIVAFRPLGTQAQVQSRYVINNIKDANIPLDWIDWAVGGLSLYLNDSSVNTESALTTKLVNVEHGQSVNGVSPAANADRAAVGFKSGKIVLAIIKSAKPWDVRNVMVALGCTDAVMLDGSTAAQLRAKTSTGTVVTTGGPRNIYSYIEVAPTSWL